MDPKTGALIFLLNYAYSCFGYGDLGVVQFASNIARQMSDSPRYKNHYIFYRILTSVFLGFWSLCEPILALYYG